MSVTAAPANDCARHVDTGTVAKLPTGFAMLENEVVIIAEVSAPPTVQGSLTRTFGTESATCTASTRYRFAMPRSSRLSRPELDKVT